MKNNFGTNISMTIFGESHGPCIGITLDGLPAGFKINLERIKEDMEKRKAKGSISTQRHEDDEVEIVSGFFNGYTTGTSLTILIQNKNTQSKDYSDIQYRLRPGHADFSAYEKYHGFQDYRGGGHFSGRLTLSLVTAGVVAKLILNTLFPQQVNIQSSLNEVGGCNDPEKFAEIIEQALRSQDSVGGIIECTATGLPAGIGEPFFDSVESVMSHLLYAIPAVKGVEFGLGFGSAKLRGSENNDPIAAPDGRTVTNHAGGIVGGITNGNPIVVRVAIKPTASISTPQITLNTETGTPEKLIIKGRHDACIAMRAGVVVEAAVAAALCDLALVAKSQGL